MGVGIMVVRRLGQCEGGVYADGRSGGRMGRVHKGGDKGVPKNGVGKGFVLVQGYLWLY